MNIGHSTTSFAQDLTGHRHDLQSHQQFEEHFVALIESTIHVPVHLHSFRDIAEEAPRISQVRPSKTTVCEAMGTKCWMHPMLTQAVWVSPPNQFVVSTSAWHLVGQVVNDLVNAFGRWLCLLGLLYLMISTEFKRSGLPPAQFPVLALSDPCDPSLCS